jgi:protocatechuate 3,4-dioxygenase beta subunit
VKTANVVGLALILFLAATWSELCAQQNLRSSIQGTVLAKGTDAPIRDAYVILNHVPTTDLSRRPPAIPEVMTDLQGRFAFNDLEPGSYRLYVVADGFTRLDFISNQPKSFAADNVFDLTAGQRLDLPLRMTPMGSVSGKITGAGGIPLIGSYVQLVHCAYDATAMRRCSEVSKATADDRGDYRLYWIEPGKYYVGVIDDALYHERTYYPGVADFQSARQVEVQSGVEVKGVDIAVPSTPMFKIQGRLVDATSGKAPPRNAVDLSLISKTELLSNFRLWDDAYAGDGSFQFESVAPGSYWIRARIGNAVGVVGVDVTSDLNNVALIVPPLARVSGRVTVEGPRTPMPESAGIFLWPRTESGMRLFGVGTGEQFAADGSFTLSNVVETDYRLSFRGLPPDVYVKEARMGSADILSQPLKNLSASQPLSIVLSANGGEIEGVVSDALKPSAGARIALIPEARLDRPDLYKALRADEAGRFKFQGIAPGRYRILAGAFLDDYAYFDPDVVSRYEDRATSVRVEEGSHQTIELRVIPE